MNGRKMIKRLMKLKYLKYLAVLFIVSSLIICYIRYFSFTKYNIRPLKECDRYLKETYYGQFKGKIVDFYREDGYYVWKLKYVDETGMEFYEYYQHSREVSEGGLYLYYDSDIGIRGISDYYWQLKLHKVYESEFQIKQYEEELVPFIIKYSFDIVQERDIENISNIIATTLIYTKENVKKISPNIIGYSVGYKDKISIYKLMLDEKTQELLNKDRDYVFQYIYDEIYNAYQEEVRKEIEKTLGSDKI